MAYPRIQWTKRVWERGLLGSMLLSLGIICVACGGPIGQPAPGQGAPTQAPSAGTVYMPRGALRASDGKPRWSADLGNEPPLMANGIAYVVLPSGADQSPQTRLRAVRLADGTQAWQTAISSTFIGTGPAVLAGNGLLVIATVAAYATAPAAQNGSDRVVQLQLVALRTSDGGVAWRTVPLAVVIEPTVDTAVPFVSQLAFADGRIVAMADASAAAPFAVAWNAADGSLAWRLPLADAGQYAGAGGGLWLAGDTLIANYGEQIGALDVVLGAWTWLHSDNGALLERVTANALITTDNGPVSALRPRDGAALWTTNLGDPAESGQLALLGASDTAVFYGSVVLCPGAVEGQTDTMQDVACPAIYALSLADGKLLWQHLFGLNPLYDAISGMYGDGMVYFHYFNFTHAMLLAFDATTGAQRWSHVVGETSAQFEPLATAAGVVYGIIHALTVNSACSIELAAYNSSNGVHLWQQPYNLCPDGSVGPLPWIVVVPG